MGALTRFLLGQDEPERQNAPLPFDTWMSYLGINYPLYGMQQTLSGTKENILGTFGGYVNQAYKTNGVVFACMLVRQQLLSEARFQLRRIKDGRPGDLYGSPVLRPLEKPWPLGTTGDLLTRAVQDADLAGNFFAVRRGQNIKRLRPDWVTLVLSGENGDPDTEIIGIVFEPGGPGSGRPIMTFTVDELMHFAPIPDPIASYRGMSWITPIVREIQADSSATGHKDATFNNGATPNMIVKLDVNTIEKFEAYKKAFRDEHEGLANAYKTLFLAGGADATVVGQNFQQLTFKELQGSAETRIAAASGVHPVVVALSEGLQGSSLNAGNFSAAARLTGDKTLRPWWRNFAGSASNIIDVPARSELWYDDRDIAFLQADVKDQAEVAQVEAGTIQTLINTGFDPDSVTAAVLAQDWNKLEHSGLVSVQLQPPMPEGPPQPALPEPPVKEDQGQLAAALAFAMEKRQPDQITVTSPPVTVNPGEVNVFNKNMEDDDLRSFATAIRPAEINVELDAVAKMFGEIEARRILEAEKAEEARLVAEAEAEKRHRELIEELKPAPPPTMVKHVKRNKDGLIELITEEPA